MQLTRRYICISWRPTLLGISIVFLLPALTALIFDRCSVAAEQNEPKADPGTFFANQTLHLERVDSFPSPSVITAVGWSPDGRRLAISSNFGLRVTLIGIDDRSRLELNRKVSFLGNEAVFLDDGNKFLTPFAGTRTKDSKDAFTLWDTQTGKAIGPVAGPTPERAWQYNRPRIFTLSADGRFLAFSSGQPNDPVAIYNTRDWSVSRTIPIDREHGGGLFAAALAFSPDSSHLAVGFASNKVTLIDLQDAQSSPATIVPYASPQGSITSVAFSPDGQWLAIGAWSVGPTGFDLNFEQKRDQDPNAAAIKIYRAQTLELVAAFPGRLAPVRQLSWRSDSQYLAAALADDTVRVFAVAGPKEAVAIARVDHPSMSAQFSPDGRRLAVASGNRLAIFALVH